MPGSEIDKAIRGRRRGEEAGGGTPGRQHATDPFKNSAVAGKITQLVKCLLRAWI